MGANDKQSRRRFLQLAGAAGISAAAMPFAGLWSSTATKSPEDLAGDKDRALVSITLDLEMSRNFPKWEDTEWDYEKGNLDAATKQYAVEAGRRVKEAGGVLHYFAVGRTLEQPDITWLKDLAAAGHPIGNHTYDHVYLLAKTPEEVQYRFKRAPWLIEGKSVAEAIDENIRLATHALKQRGGITANGFRTPGGFATGLNGREDVQKMLLDNGFTWVSSKYPPHPNTAPMTEPDESILRGIVEAQPAAQPFVYPSGLIELPMSPISDIGAFRTGRWKVESFMEAIRRGLEWAIGNRACFDFLAHPSCLVATDPDFKTIDMILDIVDRAGERASVVGLDVQALRAGMRARG